VEASFRFTTLDGVVLHYKLLRGQGTRPVLVLLHGMASNLTRWSEFVEHTNLKDRYDILRLDLRGHGESFSRTRIGMEVWTRDLVELLAHLGYERAVLVGHSLGANVALRFAIAHPGRIAGICLIDLVLTEALRGQALWLRRFSWLIRSVVAVLRFANGLGMRRARIPTRDLRKLDEQVRKQFLEAGKGSDFVKRYTSPLADVKHFPSAHYLQEVVEITRPISGLERLKMPVLALISQAVTFTDTEKTKAALARCPHVQIDSLTAYHWPLTEKPIEVRTAIEKWANQV
jgi:esterase